MSGDVHDQERGNSFVFGYVGHGGKIAMLFRVVAELFTALPPAAVNPKDDGQVFRMRR